MESTVKAGKVLLVVIDQLRADCITGALSHAINLPNLRSLMNESVSFNSHYTVTNPCGPSRASLLTGQYAMNHRAVRNGTPLADHHVTIATELRKVGREPLLFGYTDISPDPATRHASDPDLTEYEGLANGFAEIVRMRLENSSSWVGYLKSKGYELPKDYWALYRPVSDGDKETPSICDPALYSAEDSDTAFLTDRTIQELSAREDHDWFSMVTYIRPHPPLVAPVPYNSMYKPADVTRPVRSGSLQSHIEMHSFFTADFSAPTNHHLHIGFDGHLENISDADTAALRAIYFGLATEVDHHIGRLVNYLRESGQYDDTLIVVTADHGEMLGDHFMWGKNSPFDEALRVPLIIRDPRNRQQAGAVVHQFSESIDVAPTIMDWVGGEPHIGFNGASLLPFLQGRLPDGWRDHVFAEVDFGDPISPTRFQRSMGLDAAEANFAVYRDGRFKYVHFNGGQPPLLFDHRDDPTESTNVARDPAYAGEFLRLATRMIDHRMTFAHHVSSRMKLTASGVQTG